MIVTQPRRIAAINVALRVDLERGGELNVGVLLLSLIAGRRGVMRGMEACCFVLWQFFCGDSMMIGCSLCSHIVLDEVYGCYLVGFSVSTSIFLVQNK